MYTDLLVSGVSDVSFHNSPSVTKFDPLRQPLTSLYVNGQVYWLFISAVWGTLRLVEAKLSVKLDDNDWDFGQILSIFLLIGLIVTAIEAITPDNKSEDGDVYDPNQDSPEASRGAIPGDGTC